MAGTNDRGLVYEFCDNKYQGISPLLTALQSSITLGDRATLHHVRPRIGRQINAQYACDDSQARSPLVSRKIHVHAHPAHPPTRFPDACLNNRSTKRPSAWEQKKNNVPQSNGSDVLLPMSIRLRVVQYGSNEGREGIPMTQPAA